jgi:CTP:molybdopterin cytidylyltransferase MocA
LFLGAVLRVRDIHQTARGLSRTLKTRIKVVEMRDPIAAIDVDKAADYTLVNAILDGRA